VLTSSWTGVPNKVAGECIYMNQHYKQRNGENVNNDRSCLYTYNIFYGRA